VVFLMYLFIEVFQCKPTIFRLQTGRELQEVHGITALAARFF
jgi:hypothetical protein